jgi:hypothetical protein
MSEQQKHLLVHLKLLAHNARKWAKGVILIKSKARCRLAGKLKEFESNVDETLKRVNLGQREIHSWSVFPLP